LVASLAGCFHVDYVMQAAEGQLDLACRARSIESARQDPDIHPRVRALLGEVPRIKTFAKDQGLVPTDSYEDFVNLDRDSVVYVVTAAPKLSLQPHRWSFPIVGSVPYLGWFDKIRAEYEAEKLAKEGYDVYVRGASAYSTLGWFADPVLSSMIEEGDEAIGELADTIIHESVHATVYIPDQSEFNESLASFVAGKLTPVWLGKRFGPASSERAAYLEREQLSEEMQVRLREAYLYLAKLYESNLPKKEKLAKKKEYLADVRAELHLAGELNNARLAGYDSYHGGDEALAALLAACGGDLRKMIDAVKTAKPEDFGEDQVDDIGPATKKLAARCKK
jgi:predicted aminopeptidase